MPDDPTVTAPAVVTVAVPEEKAVNVVMPDGTTMRREDPKIPLRISSKQAVTGSAGAYSVLEVMQAIDWPGMWFDDFLQTQAAAWLVTFVVMLITARFTKDPIKPTPV